MDKIMLDNTVVSADREFRIKIASVLVNTDWLLHYGAIMSPDYFDSKEEKDVVIWINEYFVKYHAVPELDDVRHGCYGNKVVPELYACSEQDLRYAADVAIEFARMQAMKIAILASVESIDKGDLSKPLELVEQARNVGIDLMNLGKELIADKDDWAFDQLHGKKVPTGWYPLDMLMGGGLMGGEYGLMLGPSKRGKTTALINIGYGGAGLLGNVNVLHVTLETPVSAVLKRYAARATGVRLKRDEDFISGMDAFLAMLEERASRVLKGRIRVIKPGHTIDDIKRANDNLHAIGFDTGLLIVDYADLLHPPRKRPDPRFEIADITRDLRDYGEDQGIPVWSASQVGRQAFNKETITMTDVAESIEKVNASDVVIAICQTDDEKAIDRGRFFVAALRDAKDNMTFPIRIDKEKQLITVLSDE